MSELGALGPGGDRDHAGAGPEGRVSDGGRRNAPPETRTRAGYAELMRRSTPAGRRDGMAVAGERGTDRGAGPVLDDPSARRPDLAVRYPADYTPAHGPPPRVDGPHEPPGRWAAGINPDRCDWEHGGGHWFNAVNDEGTIKAVDGQSGRTETWPPSAAGLGFDESDMRRSDAIFFTADGKVVPG